MIDLTQLSPEEVKYKEEINGVSFKHWLTYKGTNYLFKSNRGHSLNESTKQDIIYDESKNNIGECFYSFLAKKYSFNCVESEFAKDNICGNVHEGVLVKSFMTDKIIDKFNLRELVINYEDSTYENTTLGKQSVHNYSVEETMLFLNNMTNSDCEYEVSENMENDLLKMAMVDLFLGQADRHERNIEFIVVAENNKKVIYPAPMFDNGFMAKLDYSSRSISELKQILKENPDYAKTYTGSEPYFTAIKKDMNTSIYGDYDYIETCFKDTIDTAQDYSVKELMLNLAKMDITKEIAEFEKAYKTQIPEDYKYVMQIVIGNRIDAFRKVYSLEQNTNLFSKETDFEK